MSHELLIYRPTYTTRWSRPLMMDRVSAGFPSPAEDYIEGRIDLNRDLIEHPIATFYIKVIGDSTVIYHAADLQRAKAWYVEVIGHAPYFDQPFYVGFNIGGFELGLDPDTSQVTPGGGSSTAYWGVADADAAHARLLELGAKPHTDVEDVGDGIRVATVRDPFGNIFGVIENRYFKYEGDE